MLFVREYARTWVLKIINHDIIQLFNVNNIVQHSWCQLDNHNDLFKKYIVALRIVKLCKPVLLLYTPSF